MMMQVMQHGDAAAALANTTVQSIINAYNHEPVNRLNTANTEHLRLTNALLRESNPIAIAKAQLDLTNAQALGTLPRQLLEAQLAIAQKSGNNTVDIPVVDADGKPRLGADGKQMILPNVTSNDIYQTLYGHQPGGLTTENKITNARSAIQDEQARQELAHKAEQALLGPVSSSDRDRKNPMLGSPQSQAHMDEFNRYSDKGYAYVWGNEIKRNWYQANTPAKGYRVYLPRNDKGQLTAKQAYFDATQKHMSMREYLEALYAKGRLKEKPEWLP